MFKAGATYTRSLCASRASIDSSEMNATQIEWDAPVERRGLTAMVQNVDTILKALTNGFVGAGMGANTDAFGVSSFNTSSNKLV